jgi:hypothetical protein
MSTRTLVRLTMAVSLLGASLPGSADAVGTAFTFQGQLRQGANTANGPCDFEFVLFNMPADGTQLATTLTISSVIVADGLFTVPVDFGPAAFTGGDRWMEIKVRCPSGSGEFATLSPRQPLTPAPYAIFSPIVLRDEQGNLRGALQLLDGGGGFFRTFGPNGALNVLLSSLSGVPDHGFAGVYNAEGRERASLQILEQGAGFAITRGPNGASNVRLSFLGGNPEHGFVSVDDAEGNTKASVFVNSAGEGVVMGDVKNFAVDHPTRPGEKIVYTSLEGGEAAIYHRGKVRLSNGRAIVVLPEHFVVLADPEAITVQLTPGSFESKGLAFGAIRDGRIEIGELQNGTGSYDVHFVVHAVRRGYEDYSPVMGAEEFAARYGHMKADLRRDDIPAPPESLAAVKR